MKGREGMMGQPKIGHSVVVASIFPLALGVLILTATVSYTHLTLPTIYSV